MLRRSIAACAAITSAWLVLGCARAPVEWADPEPLPQELASATHLAFDGRDRLVAVPLPAIRAPEFTGQCAGSLRLARDTAGDWYAVWWSARIDNTADLLVSRSVDGVSWAPAQRVDTTDAAPVGCRRAPPSIHADRGSVHVAYAMRAREGPGIFTSHSMDGGRMFHSPVAVAYGERIGLTAIAASGDLVVVAYDDPNSNPPRIGLAISRTMAHLFETRTIVSPPTGAARAPGVALHDRKIAVTWSPAAADAPSARVVRIGELQ